MNLDLTQVCELPTVIYATWKENIFTVNSNHFKMIITSRSKKISMIE